MKDAIPNFDAFIGGFPLFAYFCKRSLSNDHDRSRRITDFDHEKLASIFIYFPRIASILYVSPCDKGGRLHNVNVRSFPRWTMRSERHFV